MIILEFFLWLSIFLIVYSYAIYPVILMLWDRIIKVPSGKFTEDWPKVTLLVAAHNEEKVIEAKIKNSLTIDYPKDKFEIIIASDGSDDQTNAIVKQYQDKGIVLLDYAKRQGKVNVLNAAVPQTSHDIVVLTDANAMYERDAVKKLVRHFDDESIGCVCGLLKFINAEGSRVGDLEGVYWRLETFLKRLEGRRGALLGANGAIYAIRKNLFVPPSANTIVDDFVIAMAVLEKGYKVIYEPEAVAVEEVAKQIAHEKKRRIRIGTGNFQALGRFKSILNPRRGFVSFAFFSHKVLRWLTPFLMIAAFILNFLLLNYDPYPPFFLFQCLFYLCALIGQMLSHKGIQIKIVSLCYYFVSMNYALLLGFWRYVRGEQEAAWDRTER